MGTLSASSWHKRAVDVEMDQKDQNDSTCETDQKLA